MSLSAGGGVFTDEAGTFIYEPIGQLRYLFVKIDDKAKKQLAAQVDKEGLSFVVYEGLRYPFSGEPMTEAPWTVPSGEQIASYVAGKRRTYSNRQIWDLTLGYIRKFGDYELEWHPTMGTMFVFQTQLKVILEALFRLPIGGPFGSGKTAILEALCGICRHGVEEANTSPAARARMSGWDISWFADEIDKSYTDDQGDSLSLVLMRTGYRRGAKYIRWDADGKKPEVMDLFHNLCYTISSDVERGLKTRSLGELTVTRSMDYRVPIINGMKESYGRKLADELFFWRLDFLCGYLSAKARTDPPMLSLDKISSMTVDEFRAELFRTMTKHMSEPEQKLLTHLFGRESELAYIVLQIESVLGIDVLDSIVEAVNAQRESELEPDDPRFEWLLERLSSISPVDDLQRKLDAEGKGPITVRMREITDEMAKWCKDTNQKTLKGSTWKSFYRRLGIQRGKNLKHGRDSEILTFDSSVRKAIRELTVTNPIQLTDIRVLSVNAANAVNPVQHPEEAPPPSVHESGAPEMVIQGSQNAQGSRTEEARDE